MNDTDMMEASADDRHKLLLVSLCCQIDCAREAWLRMIDEFEVASASGDLTDKIAALGKQAENYQDCLFSIFRARRGIKPEDLK